MNTKELLEEFEDCLGDGPPDFHKELGKLAPIEKKGHGTGRRKLTDEQVMFLRYNNWYSAEEKCKMFGISRRAYYAVMRYETYRGLP